MLDALDMSCILTHLLPSHVLSSMKRASGTFSGFACTSAFTRRSSYLTTAARFAAAVTYTRTV
eukprot:1939941-Pyramimonas_sp.AAC.1